MNLDWGMFFIPGSFARIALPQHRFTDIRIQIFPGRIGLVQEAVFSISFLILDHPGPSKDWDGVIKTEEKRETDRLKVFHAGMDFAPMSAKMFLKCLFMQDFRQGSGHAF